MWILDVDHIISEGFRILPWNFSLESRELLFQYVRNTYLWDLSVCNPPTSSIDCHGKNRWQIPPLLTFASPLQPIVTSISNFWPNRLIVTLLHQKKLKSASVSIYSPTSYVTCHNVSVISIGRSHQLPNKGWLGGSGFYFINPNER